MGCKKQAVEYLRERMPKVFIATRLDELSDGLINWSTIQNERILLKKNNQGEKLESSLIYRGKRKILIDRDSFLSWWSSGLR